MPKLLTRRRFLLSSAGLLALGGAGAGYMRWVEPQWLEVTRRTLAGPPAPDPAGAPPLTLVHLSDFHFSRYVTLEYLAGAFARVQALRPDVICVTGDFITATRDFPAAAYVPVLARLAAIAPTYATLGNHDGGEVTGHLGGPVSVDSVGRVLQQAGLTWLQNQSARLTVRGRTLQLVGLGDLWNGACRPEIAFRGFAPEPGAWVVALSHNPDSKRFLLPYPWHALLCGHTHGGQIWPAVLGRFTAPVQDKRYLAGLYRYENRWLHINRGLGNLHGVRLLCRPEISVLTLA